MSHFDGLFGRHGLSKSKTTSCFEYSSSINFCSLSLYTIEYTSHCRPWYLKIHWSHFDFSRILSQNTTMLRYVRKMITTVLFIAQYVNWKEPTYK